MSAALPDILRSLRCDRVANDRRRSPRVGLRARVALETLQRMAEPQAAWMRDLSEGGAGLLVARELRVDQSILLHLPLSPNRTIAVRCRVVHCERVGGFWRAGVQFVEKPWQAASASGSSADVGGESTTTEVSDLDAQIKRISEAVLE